MAIQQAIRKFGTPTGAAGIEVIERPGSNALADPSYGTVAFYGVFRRGPMGVPIPINSKSQYDEIFGDPRDPSWHLFLDGSHMAPDAIDGYYATSGGAGQVWVTRLELDTKAKKAELILKNRIGSNALKVTAANEGRWGGMSADLSSISGLPIVAATSRTFTVTAPNIRVNQFAGATVEFTNLAGRKFQIVANTESDPNTGVVIFTTATQYDLAALGVSGPIGLTGFATYSFRTALSGTISFPLQVIIIGTVTFNNTTVTGSGTVFNSDFKVGSNIYFEGEARRIESITSDTTLTIAEPFSSPGTGVSVSKDNLTVIGSATTFLSQMSPGSSILVDFPDGTQVRTVAAVSSDTSLTLTSAFSQAVPAGTTAYRYNRTVTGSGTNFTAEVQVGQFIIDPTRPNSALRVAAVNSATTLTIDGAFANNFTNVQLSRQSHRAFVTLRPPAGQGGLSVEVAQGTRFPDTHFGLIFRFNNSIVLQVADASLDPDDPFFVESVVNDANVAYRTGSTNYHKWVSVESLWSSAYTTDKTSDVRPCNGAGTILAVAPDRIYTVANIDYNAALNDQLYPNPYALARAYFRVKGVASPFGLTGTVSSSGLSVTGTGTRFRTELKVGDYLYNETQDTARKIRSIQSDTALTLETAFTANLPALSRSTRAGFLQVDRTYDLSKVCAPGDRFLTVFPQFLNSGYDGDTANLLPYYFTRHADPDINVLENATWGKNLGLIRMACPGISDISVQKAFAQYASEKAYEFRAEIPSTFNSASAAEAFVNRNLGRNDFQSIAFPSYGYITNPFGAGDRLVSISGDIMGGESRRAINVQGYHVPFAGISAILPRVVKLPFNISPADEAVINISGLQPIKFMMGNAVVFGARTPSLSSIYDFLHVRRIQSNYVRVFLEARGLLEMMFQPNQPGLADQIIVLLENFARKEYRKGIYTQYLTIQQAVQISNSGDVGRGSGEEAKDIIVSIVNGKLSISYRYTPTGILERLSINCGPDILTANYGGSLISQQSF